MEPTHDDDVPDALRPRPRPGFVEELERTLRRETARPARRPLLAAATATAGIAVATLGLSVAGVGPLADSTQDVTATSSCHYELVKQRARVPHIVAGPQGQPRIVYRYRVVERRIKRCR
jgi:hypothetical protein